MRAVPFRNFRSLPASGCSDTWIDPSRVTAVYEKTSLHPPEDIELPPHEYRAMFKHTVIVVDGGEEIEVTDSIGGVFARFGGVFMQDFCRCLGAKVDDSVFNAELNIQNLSALIQNDPRVRENVEQT